MKNDGKNVTLVVENSIQMDDSLELDTPGTSSKQDNSGKKKKTKNKNCSNDMNKSASTTKQEGDKIYHEVSTNNSDISIQSTSTSPTGRNNLIKKSKKEHLSDKMNSERNDPNNNTNHKLTFLDDYLPLNVSDSEQRDVSKKKHKKSKEKRGESHKEQYIKIEVNCDSVSEKISEKEHEYKLKRKHDGPANEGKAKKKKSKYKEREQF